MKTALRTATAFLLLVGALTLSVFADSGVRAQDAGKSADGAKTAEKSADKPGAPANGKPSEAKTYAPAAKAISRYYAADMAGNQVGGVSATVTETATGYEVKGRMLMKIVRWLGKQRDEFTSDAYSTYVYDKAWVLVSDTKATTEAGVLTKHSVTFENGKLVYNHDGPGSKFTKSFELPKNYSDSETVQRALAAKWRAQPAEKHEPVSETFSAFSASREGFAEKTMTLLGEAPVTHGNKEHTGLKFSVKEPQGTTVSVLDADFLPMSAEMTGVVALRWVDDSPFDFVASDGGIQAEVPVSTAIAGWKNLRSLSLTVTVNGDKEEKPVFTTNHYGDATRDGSSYTLKLKPTAPWFTDEKWKSPALPLANVPDDVKAYLKPTPLSQSDDAAIVARAESLAGDAKDAKAVAAKITGWVYATVKKRSGARGNATASEVIKSMEGDCTEHAALTVALCRAAGIPARNVSGMEYLTEDSGTGREKAVVGYHAWAEAWLGQWVAVDATIPEVGTTARYFFFGYNEPGQEDGSGLLARTLGKLKIEITSYTVAGEKPVIVKKAPAAAGKSPDAPAEKPSEQPAGKPADEPVGKSTPRKPEEKTGGEPAKKAA